MKEVRVEVQSDHLERMAHVRKPLLAVAELVWNSLDADADQVKVTLSANELGGVTRVRVSDNGHGIHYDESVPAFKNLGGSPKRLTQRTRDRRRLLHGKAGKGRFRAFSLGNRVTWRTVYKKNGDLLEYTITGTRAGLGVFHLDDPQPSKSSNTGTVVDVAEIDKNYPSLLGYRAVQEITELFAFYLRQYGQVRVYYNGEQIDPARIEERAKDYELPGVVVEDGKEVDAALTVIEWRTPTERTLYLCDKDGFALGEIPPGIQAKGYNFTAYLKSDYLRELDDDNALSLAELHPGLKALLDAAKKKLRAYFRRRNAEDASHVVERWKKEDVYPYEGDPADVLEETQRQVFDLCALNLAEFLPDFEEADPRSKRIALRLLRHAVEHGPDELQQILEKVLDLPMDKRGALAKLLQKTSLGAIISAAKTVTDRLDFLRGLEILVFDPSSREQLLERSQLHKILERHTWVFGEQFNMAVASDESLTSVLKKHMKLLGREEKVETPVKRLDDSTGIIDLMMSRQIPQSRGDEREHLIVELKRPKQPVDAEVAQQIESYAFAVAEDERFRDTKTHWIFWAVSNEIDETVRRKARQRGRPRGLLYDDPDGRVSIWVKSWGQIIQECTARLEFVAESLSYSATHDEALEYLRETHEHYLPSTLLEDQEEVTEKP